VKLLLYKIQKLEISCKTYLSSLSTSTNRIQFVDLLFVLSKKKQIPESTAVSKALKNAVHIAGVANISKTIDSSVVQILCHLREGLGNQLPAYICITINENLDLITI
jgi:hypothetical protein